MCRSTCCLADFKVDNRRQNNSFNARCQLLFFSITKTNVNCVQTSVAQIELAPRSSDFAHRSAACSDCVDNNITNRSQVAFGEMEYHLFHRGLAP